MHRRPPSPATYASRRWRRGFTLVEAVATMVVLGALGSVVSSVIFRTVQDYTVTATSAQVQLDLSSTMDRLDRSLREIDVRSGSNAPNITSITPTSIAYTAGGATGGFALSGSSLVFTDATGSTILLDDVIAFSIIAYDESNNAMGASLSGAACDPVRRILILLTVTRAGAADTLRTRLFLRSTMEGAG
ncbi:MAG: PulJ/GspJ family protein [Phycisphaerales bacterium]